MSDEYFKQLFSADIEILLIFIYFKTKINIASRGSRKEILEVLREFLVRRWAVLWEIYIV